jgi:hypothetical protein
VSRRLKLATREMGMIELLLIYQVGDVWEDAWKPLQGTPLGDFLPVVSDEVMNHALHGWTRPLVDALGLPPVGLLRKMPEEHRACEHRERCIFFDSAQCVPAGKKLPDCFQPENLATDVARTLAYEVIRLWREGVYTVAVKEAPDAHRSYRRVR